MVGMPQIMSPPQSGTVIRDVNISAKKSLNFNIKWNKERLSTDSSQFKSVFFSHQMILLKMYAVEVCLMVQGWCIYYHPSPDPPYMPN